MCQWPCSYGVSLWHIRLLVQFHLSLLGFFVTGTSQRTLYICYPIDHMLANIQRSLTITGNKRIHQIIYYSQLDFNQDPRGLQAVTITTRPLKHYV